MSLFLKWKKIQSLLANCCVIERLKNVGKRCYWKTINFLGCNCLTGCWLFSRHLECFIPYLLIWSWQYNAVHCQKQMLCHFKILKKIITSFKEKEKALVAISRDPFISPHNLPIEQYPRWKVNTITTYLTHTPTSPTNYFTEQSPCVFQ